MNHRVKIYCAVLLSAVFFIGSAGNFAFADTIEGLQAKIADRERLIKQLEGEIAETQKQIDSSRNEQNTLKGAISTLDAERKKVLAQIKVTEQKISSKQLEIESLGFSIDDKEESIRKSHVGLGQTIRDMDSVESQSNIATFLNNKSLSDVWDSIAESKAINGALSTHITGLKTLKKGLEKNKAEAETIRRDLIKLNVELSARKKIAETAKADKQQLLTRTKNQESEYQKLLKKHLADKNAFEQELLEFESQLKFTIDPNSLPSTGSGVLHWPLDFVKITQYFGNTDFATRNPQIYNGMGHNGIDLRASVGTAIKASLPGVIKGVGDTDNACPGTSYGKWILIEHSNGLSTLYAHLSAFAVKTGDLVATGDVIGWSGNTGYTTGPHLHFTVYATAGVQIMSRKSKVCNATYTMPVASFNAYLNPLSYL